MRCVTALAILAPCILFATPSFAGGRLPSADGEAEEAKAPPTLEVLQRFAVPADATEVGDIRWASKTSVYIAYLRGLAEVSLEEGLPRIRSVLPPTAEARQSLGPLQNLAVSGNRMLVADIGMTLLWGDPRENQPNGPSRSAVKLGAFHDLDMRDDTVVLYGVPDIEPHKKNPGAILWRSSFSKGLEQWEILYESEEIAADYGVLLNLLGPGTGAIRFQRDGSLVLAPNALPGVFLFSPSGKLKKTWSPDDLWGDGGKRWQEGRVEAEGFERFLATQRVIDDVIALPHGPAIIVREPEDPVRWRLGVLGPEVEWYDIPTAGISSVAQLHADADDKGRIVFVGVPRELYDEAAVSTTQVIVARLP